MALSKAFDDALVYAADLHRDQVRKGSGIPYIAHLMSVSSRVLSAGGTEIQAIAGLLHDAAEDQGGEPTLQEIRRRFGFDVAQIVYDQTRLASTQGSVPCLAFKQGESLFARVPCGQAR